TADADWRCTGNLRRHQRNRARSRLQTGRVGRRGRAAVCRLVSRVSRAVSLPPILQHLRIPVIGAPLFIVSNPKLVIAQCTSGIVGSFPSLNARPAELLDEWLHEVNEALAAWNRDHPDRPAAPFAVNQTVHRS